MKNDADIPSILFKYCDERAVDIFESKRLLITTPNQFNDPFELRPVAAGPPDEKSLRRALMDDRNVTEIWTRQVLRGSKWSKRQVKEYMRKNLLKTAKELMTALPLRGKRHADTAQAKFSQKAGILCLSEVDDDILMWSHYGKFHQGFVVGFRTDCNEFTKPTPLRRVRYGPARAEVDLSKALENDFVRDQVMAVLLTKADQWNYEKEWRLVRRLDQCVKESAGDERTRYYLQIHSKIVHSVCFGCRCPDELKKRVIELLSVPELKHVHLRTAQMHDTEFKLVLK